MNGTFTAEQRQLRKRALESELAAVRTQKAEVLRAIGQISKKQRLGGPPPPSVQMSHEAKVEHENRYHREELARIWGHCSKIIAALLKNRDTKIYFGEPVRADLFPRYYTVIKDPRDLGTIKSESLRACTVLAPPSRRGIALRSFWALRPGALACTKPVHAWCPNISSSNTALR